MFRSCKCPTKGNQKRTAGLRYRYFWPTSFCRRSLVIFSCSAPAFDNSVSRSFDKRTLSMASIAGFICDYRHAGASAAALSRWVSTRPILISSDCWNSVIGRAWSALLSNRVPIHYNWPDGTLAFGEFHLHKADTNRYTHGFARSRVTGKFLARC